MQHNALAELATPSTIITMDKVGGFSLDQRETLMYMALCHVEEQVVITERKNPDE